MFPVKIKALKSGKEFDQVKQIQKTIWNHKDIDLTSPHQFYIAVKSGAILLGAIVDNKIIGFVYSFPSICGKRFAQHSRQLALLPEYRGRQIGKKLKIAQKKEALCKGFDLITWTADPLIAKNANLNFHRLHATSKIYYKNYYRHVPSLAVAKGIPTDRLFLEWDLQNETLYPRQRILEKMLIDESYQKVVYFEKENEGKNPVFSPLMSENEKVLIEVPNNISIHKDNPDWIKLCQQSLSKGFNQCFKNGYHVTDFVYGNSSFYVLEKQE